MVHHQLFEEVHLRVLQITDLESNLNTFSIR